ncbi:hypothetical protein EDD27_3945 [Nonomuraea polychroma]|uniref:Uncharacterized protein n=1 Tax=Nonomuraea polychroma TaxID=46176 RepID=A0A438M6S9_9ACTN|nr:ankyrin repeat domain-containing protein [Nonomuraea polychroma]RVX41414.1 hypothetical protein EDD27_3945 [Nonomuraea polychroma]
MRTDDRDRGEPRADWQYMASADWNDLDLVRGRLAAGADPNGPLHPSGYGTPLSEAAGSGSPEVVATLAALVRDVDADNGEGQTALWAAVCGRRAENAAALLAAGADAWRPIAGDWSPGRLALLSPLASHFEHLPGAVPPPAEERAAAAEADRFRGMLGDVDAEGLGIAFVAGIDEDETIRRLGASPERCPVLDLDDPPFPFCEPDEDEEEDDYLDPDDFCDLRFVGVTGVEGGCVVSQPWGFLPANHTVLGRLSAGTVAYGLYLNPKSGAQGMVARDGTLDHDWGLDIHPIEVGYLEPGGGNVLLRFLYSSCYAGDAVGYGCAYTGLRISDRRAVTGPFRRWVQVPGWDEDGPAQR